MVVAHSTAEPEPQLFAPPESPHVVLVIPRGEAVRNFLYSETLETLRTRARVTVLSVAADRVTEDGVEAIPLEEWPQPRLAYRLRVLTENSHDRWLWSRTQQNQWQLRDLRAAEHGKTLQRLLVKGAATCLANRPCLRLLTALERRLQVELRPTRDFDRLFAQLQPDLVFNGSHIHGPAGELPLRVAHAMGIPTAGFIFSWDNLTSRSRIFVPYDHYFVWFDDMKRQLLEIYPEVDPASVHVTGTPQFDFHHGDRYRLERGELCARLGIDPGRPYVLYTAGIAHHFFEEHRHVERVIDYLAEIPEERRPQLVVRTNIKDTSPEMKEVARTAPSWVVFPQTQWDPVTLTAHRADLAFYTSLLAECCLGINAASTVTLELLIFDKPVINLDFDPPGCDLPDHLGYPRHIRFDHYWPVAESGAVMVARSDEDLRSMMLRGITDPSADAETRQRFLASMFGSTLDGGCGRRVGESLLEIASANAHARSRAKAAEG